MTALGAVFDAFAAALYSGTPAWGNRVFVDRADADTPYPYVVFSRVGGGELPWRNSSTQSVEFLMQVKAIADDLTVAMQCADEISTRLRHKGEQDVTSGALYGGTSWDILTTMQGDVIHLLEDIDGRNVWHEGHEFRVVLEN